MNPHKTTLSLATISLFLSGCSVVKAPVDLTTTTIRTTGKVAVSTIDMTGDVASAAGSVAGSAATVTRAVADLGTSPAVQDAALESRGRTAKEIIKHAAK